MSASPLVAPANLNFKKIHSKLGKNGKINVNHIVLNRNNSNPKFFASKMHDNSHQKNNFNKERVSPIKNHFNKSLSTAILNRASDNLKKTKKYYIKSPLSLFKGNVPPSTNNIDLNKNIPLLPVNINKNNNIKPANHQGSVEYNSINCIINNFNLSCKNLDSHEDNKKADSLIKFKKYYDFFNKNNNKLKNHMNNLKKNNSMSNYANVKNLSHLSDINNSNINNITNDNIKTEEILIENKQKQAKIQQRHQENKKKMIYLKELEKKNLRLKNEYQEIKIKHVEYSKSLERLMKFLRVLKNSGMDVSEMMDNISSGEDYDEYVEDENENEDTENSDEEKEEKNETVLSDGSVLSNLKQLSSGLLRNHDEYTKGSKLTLKLQNIPMLNICKIKNH